MPGYKHFCRYCNQLIEPDSNVCPLCGKVNPLGPSRCPKCRNPIQKTWKHCSHCGLTLAVVCPKCRRTSFLGDYCDHCDARLVVICRNPKCRAEQPPIGDVCVRCSQPLPKS
jgi:hypothetical protein